MKLDYIIEGYEEKDPNVSIIMCLCNSNHSTDNMTLDWVLYGNVSTYVSKMHNPESARPSHPETVTTEKHKTIKSIWLKGECYNLFLWASLHN